MSGARVFIVAVAAFAGGLPFAGWLVYGYSVEIILFPAVAGGTILLLAMAAVLKCGRTVESDQKRTGARVAPASGAFVSMAAILPAVGLFGLVAGGGVFLLFSLLRAGLPIRGAVVFAATGAGVLYAVFDRVLEAPLPRGLFF